MAFGRSSLLAALLIAAAAALAYHDTFSVPFLFDDIPSIVDNPTIRSFRTAWAPPPENGITVSGRPLLNLTLALNHAWSGSAVWSYHLFNLLIHVTAGCTLFGIVRRTLEAKGRWPAPARAVAGFPAGEGIGVANDAHPGNAAANRSPLSATAIQSDSRDASWLALAVALLWTLHPLQTESVTYIVQRAESLVSLMYLLTFWCFVRSVEPGASRAWAWLAWLACLSGMAAKEVMVTAPVMVALYDRIFVAGSWKEVWGRRGRQHLALIATWVLLFWLVLRTGGRGGTAGFAGEISPWAYALTQVGAVGHYLRLIFWPQPLIFDYGKEIARGWGEVWPAALVVFPLLAASVWTAWRGRAVGFLGVCFFAVLAPSSSFVPVLTQTMSEHRLYLALAAVVTILVCGLHAWWGRRGLLVCAALAVGLGAATIRRNHDYRSEQAIWEDTMAKRPGNARAPGILGAIHERADRLEQARSLLEKAIALAPDYIEAQNNLGGVWVKLDRPDLAVECFRRAAALDPRQAMVLHNLGSALIASGHPRDAVEPLEQSLRLEPDRSEPRVLLAAVLTQEGRLAEAAPHYERYLKDHPDDADGHRAFSAVLVTLGRRREAFIELSTAVRLQPGNAVLRNELGVMLGHFGRLADAIAQFQEALRLQPDFTAARENAELATQALKSGKGARPASP
ncbi:MAG TPA: tetratricopeptide repeat protein [Lacunisphaera sp.]|nr:tetratricopeptide repeat protein [Lacunisphaera sp.]